MEDYPCQQIVNYDYLSSSSDEDRLCEDQDSSLSFSSPTEYPASKWTTYTDYFGLEDRVSDSTSSKQQEVKNDGSNCEKITSLQCYDSDADNNSINPGDEQEESILESSHSDSEMSEDDELEMASQKETSSKSRKAYSLPRSQMTKCTRRLIDSVKRYFTKPVNLQRGSAPVAETTFDKVEERMKCKLLSFKSYIQL